MSLALKKALTPSNIQSRFRGVGIWPLNLDAMKLKMDLIEVFKKQTRAEFISKEDQINEITEDGLPLPPTQPTHYYVDSLEGDAEIDVDVEEEDIQEDLEAPTNIGTFLKMSQEMISKVNTRAESIIDYSQSQILTSDGHVDTLYNKEKKN